jgi:hypothetical protein
MSDDRTVKKVFLGKPDGRRKVGRPKLRWRNGTENDLEFTGVKRWRKKAEDRSLWAIILKETLVNSLKTKHILYNLQTQGIPLSKYPPPPQFKKPIV